jgi:hypothetical protein
MRQTLIGNPTGENPERRVSNPNEGFGNWKDAMSKAKPPTAEEKAAQMQQELEYDAAMVQTVRERMQDQPPQDPQAMAQFQMENFKKGHAVMMPAMSAEQLAQLQRTMAKTETTPAAKKPGFFKRLFG